MAAVIVMTGPAALTMFLVTMYFPSAPRTVPGANTGVRPSAARAAVATKGRMQAIENRTNLRNMCPSFGSASGVTIRRAGDDTASDPPKSLS